MHEICLRDASHFSPLHYAHYYCRHTPTLYADAAITPAVRRHYATPCRRLPLLFVISPFSFAIITPRHIRAATYAATLFRHNIAILPLIAATLPPLYAIIAA
jgi:hypothetical protein